MSENSSDLGAFLAGFVIGGLVGAATAIILAPQSGEETRAQLAVKSGDLLHAGEVQMQHYREAANTASQQYMDRAGEMVTHTQEQARIVLDRGKETAENGNAAAETLTEPTDDSEQSA